MIADVMAIVNFCFEMSFTEPSAFFAPMTSPLK